MEKLIIILSCSVVCSSAYFLPDNTHKTQHWLPTDLKLDEVILNLTKMDDTYHHLVKITRIKFRYFPTSRKIPETRTNGSIECLEQSSNDFPEDLFTMEQKRNGAIALHFILGVYCFTLLACVCNDYFLPTVEVICKVLNLSEDVAAATFMAIATSAPEFFVNIVGTFITESDIGVGTIVGSSLFNTLGVGALGGLAATSVIQLDWWPLTRDCVIYICTVTMLVLITRDEKIHWYEALLLLCFYVVYFLIMWQNENIHNFVLKIMDSFRRKSVQCSESGSSSPPITTIMNGDLRKEEKLEIDVRTTQEKNEEEEMDEPLPVFSFPHNETLITKIWWVYSWPIRFILKCTIPCCTKRHYLFPFTFIMCIAWIGSNSYLVSWMITVIGSTFKIPDFIMGVTLLAAGGCLPEAISIVLIVRKGQGGMGVSNSLGSNTLTILLSLGLPWFIKTMIGWEEGETYISMESDSLYYTIMALILAVCILYITISLSGYQLCKRVGIILISMYAIFLTSAILLEMFYVYDGKLYPCEE